MLIKKNKKLLLLTQRNIFNKCSINIIFYKKVFNKYWYLNKCQAMEKIKKYSKFYKY